MKKIPCEVYSRIVGYLRPVQNWNVGKRQEWKDRQVYSVEKLSAKVSSMRELMEAT